ncbi:MAG: purine-nucleoside phosphorylase [Calditrichaceae bacterium]|jgi:purine-nucleoside phosphorylase
MNKEISEALGFIKTFNPPKVKAAIILGSGLGTFADTLQNAVKIPTNEIPNYPESTVEGHKGYLVFGYHNDIPILAIQGRTHYYEGYPIKKVTLVVRIIQALGIDIMMVTNAAGAVNPRFKPGDLMLITDQVNFLFNNPLIGPNDYEGPRFPDMSNAYSADFFKDIERIALEKNIAVKRGVLWASTGPTYETGAEVKMVQKMGGDAASMSTVPEVIAAVHAGIKVIGISCITNYATGITAGKLDHKEVTETANQVKEKFLSLVSGIIIDIFSRFN